MTPIPPPGAVPDQADAWRARYRQMVSDETLWRRADIARELDVSLDTVKGWRRMSRAARRRAQAAGLPYLPHPNTLPDPHDTVMDRPVWQAGVIRQWAMRTERMDPLTFVACHPSPPGRPPADHTRRQGAA